MAPVFRVAAARRSHRDGTPRYTHHGIYVGDGKVVHYVGLSRRLRRGPIEEVSLHSAIGTAQIIADAAHAK